jgi:hypothetical protein
MKIINLKIASQILALGLAVSTAPSLKAQTAVNDLDRDGISNISDTDVDNDGILNGSDSNIDGGVAKSGPLKGQYIGDRIANDNTAELDMDADGLLDNAANETDIDADALADNAAMELDIDADGRADTAANETDIDGDGITDISVNETDIDGDGLADDEMTETDIDGDSVLDNAVAEQDIDGDGLLDEAKTESDMDGDGIINAVDKDKDGDGILDTTSDGASFSLYSKALQSISFTASGSAGIANTNEYLGGRTVVVADNSSPTGIKLYSIESNGSPGLLISNRQGEVARLATLPAGFPELSWAMGIAYDSKRNLIVVSSLGGEGFIYRFDIAQNKWLDYTSLEGIDMTFLTYNAESDSLVGWQIPAGGPCFLSPEGKFQKSVSLKTRLREFGYDQSGYGFEQSIRVVANGDNITLLRHDDSSPFTPDREGVVTKIWSYNSQQDKVSFTYKK